MSFSNSRRFEVLMAGFACVFFVLIAGSASAQDFPNDSWSWDDDLESAAGGFLDASFSSNYTQVDFQCGGGVSIWMWTEHPDDVGIKKNRASVAQKRKENQPVVYVDSGPVLNDDAYLTCDKASISSSAKFAKSSGSSVDKGKAKGKAKNCTCELGDAPGGFNTAEECAVFEAALEATTTACSETKRLRGRVDLDSKTIKSLSIQAKGELN